MVDGGQRDEVAPASGTRVPIVLVCSTLDIELADTAAAALRTRGFEVVVMGAAEDPSSRLNEIVHRFERQGLYVLCRGGELDRDGVDRLRSILRAEDVPFGRTLTLATSQGAARGLEERVVSVARRMVTGRFDRADMPRLSDEQETEPESTGDADARVESLANATPSELTPGHTEEVETLVDGPESPTDPEDAFEDEDTYQRIDQTVVTRHPIPAAVQVEDSSAPSASSDVDDDLDISNLTPRAHLRWVVIGGAAVLLTVIVAVALSGSDEPETVAPESPALVRGDAEPVDDPAEKTGSEAPETPEVALANADSETEDSASDETPTFDLDGAEKALAHRSRVDPALLDSEPLPSAAPTDRARVTQALMERQVRSWNAFLVTGEDAPNMSFADAETFCKTLSAGGITGWRLAAIGELLSLSGANMLERKAVVWSETPGDAFGDTRIVLNVRKGSTSPVDVGWDGARPVCVRIRE